MAFASFILFTTGCKEKDFLRPFGDDDGVAPSPVSNVTVRNFSGGATLKYKLPQDVDLSYVCASFVGTDGRQREYKASAYSDSVRIEGLGDTKNYDVTLTAYDKYENASQPVVVKIKPLTPPIIKVFESLEHEIAFGGCMLYFENPDEFEVGIYVNVRDSVTNQMEFYDVYFTKKSEGKYAVRGLSPVKTDFEIYVQDSWGNRSAALKFSGVPIPEEEISSKKIRAMSSSDVFGDLTNEDIISPLWQLVDGIISSTNYTMSNSPLPFPHRFTFDLGVLVKMSRIKTWQLQSIEGRWQHGAWRKFKVYGCEQLPTREMQGNDPLKGWTLMGTFESIKPSGLPMGQINDEDFELLKNGEEWMFEQNLPPIRYIRFEVNAVHSNLLLSCMSEIKFWGNVLDENPEEK